MADFLGLMKQAAELKSKMEAMQAELDQIEVEGTSGGGLVTVVRGVTLKDAPWSALWPNLVVLAAFAIVLFSISAWRFRKI